MKKQSLEQFNSSYDWFHKYQDEKRKENNGHFGSLAWTVIDQDDRFILECWNVSHLSDMRIYQIWPDGGGFTTWELTKVNKQ